MRRLLATGRALVTTIILTLSFHAVSQEMGGGVEQLIDSYRASNTNGKGVSGGIRPAILPSLDGAASTIPSYQGSTELRDGGRVPQPPNQVKQTEPNQFQRFLESSTGKLLPLFGQDFFSNVPSTFAPVTDAPVAPDYVVGPGDEVVIRAWGQIEMNERLAVDRNGMLVIPKVGAVFVGGMRYQDMQGAIHAEMIRVFRNFEMAVTMGGLRGIKVFVVGQAQQPGSYTIGSMSTLVNALFAAGGPSPTGSMRRIQVKRANKILTEFDLYDMLLNGDTSHDVRLRQGDVIVIPKVGPLVAITGVVNKPGVFELKHDRAELEEVIAWAGGLATTANPSMVSVERIEEGKSRRVAELRLEVEGLKHSMQDGDLVSVFSISPRFGNAITVRGFVAGEGRYPWRDGLRIRDLLPNADAVTSPAFWRERNKIGVTDSVNRNTLIAANEVSWDYAVIERLNADRTTELLPFNLGAAVINGDPQQNLLLQPGDVISIFSKADVRVPRDRQRRYVRLEGEFVASGIYSAKPGETLRQLVARIGGFSPSAYLFGAEFTRESARQMQQKQLDETLDRMEAEVQRVSAEASRNALSAEDMQSRKGQLDAQKGLIAKMRQVKATGRIVLDLDAERVSLKDLPDLPLEDGDRFYVPHIPSVVSVFGSVFNPNAFIYRESRRADDYLSLAGGPTRGADEGSLYLLRANGSVVSKRQKGWFGGVGGEKIMPGDAIVVPEDFERISLSKELKDWSQVFYQFALGVAGLKVLRN